MKRIYSFSMRRFDNLGNKVLTEKEMKTYARKLANRYGETISVIELLSLTEVFTIAPNSSRAALRAQLHKS